MDKHTHQVLKSFGAEGERQPFPSLEGKINEYEAAQISDSRWHTYFRVDEQPFAIEDNFFHSFDLGEIIKVYYQAEEIPLHDPRIEQLRELERRRVNRVRKHLRQAKNTLPEKAGEKNSFSESLDSLPEKTTRFKVMGYQLFHPDHTLKQQVAFASAAFYEE